MEDDYIISCGRTGNRGNLVEVQLREITVKISDDKKHPISQEKLRDICIDVINRITA